MKARNLTILTVHLGIAAMLMCGGDSGYLRTEPVLDVNVPENEKKVISVLSFEDRTMDTRRFRAWGRGMPEQIMARLSSVPYFSIVARDNLLRKLIDEQALQMTGITDQSSTVKIGRMLNARYMVTGSFQILGALMQITALVLDVETSRVIQTATVRGEYIRFFELQNEIAIQIAEGLKVKLNPRAKQKIMTMYDTRVVDASLANYEGEEKLEKIVILKHQKKLKEAKALNESAKKSFKEALEHDTKYERAKLNLMKLAHAVPMTL